MFESVKFCLKVYIIFMRKQNIVILISFVLLIFTNCGSFEIKMQLYKNVIQI